jgi:hypothetical protein
MLTIVQFTKSQVHLRDWSTVLLDSNSATYLHSWEFLSYHRDRYEDCSTLMYDGQRPIAVFPAALVHGCEIHAVSHPGATFGGLVCRRHTNIEQLMELNSLLKEFFKKKNVKKLLIKKTPDIFNIVPDQENTYALHKAGFMVKSSALSRIVDLREPKSYATRKRRNLKPLSKFQNLTIVSNISYLHEYWSILSDNLQVRHQSKPVHSLPEISNLFSVLPDVFKLYVVTEESSVIAGVLLVKINRVLRCQYIACTERGRELCALDFLFDYLISRSASSDLWFLDFGTSQQSDNSINLDLYRYKSEFGGFAVTFDVFEKPI